MYHGTERKKVILLLAVFACVGHPRRKTLTICGGAMTQAFMSLTLVGDI